MYKDKDKQREANKRIQAKRRAKGVTQGVIESGCDKGVTVTKADSHVDASDIGVVKALHQAISKPKRGKDIKCITIGDQVRSMKTMAMLHSTAAVCTGVVTGKPGDSDYNGICTEEWIKERKGVAS